MSIIFSRRCEYALQAMLYLALRSNGTTTTIKELTEELGIPFHFIAKILQDLKNQGLLTSFRGSSGGFSLGVPPEKITVLQIIDAIDGSGFLQNCLLGFPECSEKNPCAFHAQWSKSRDEISTMLMKKTILEMANEMQKPVYQRVSHNHTPSHNLQKEE